MGGETGLGKPPSAGPGPASRTQHPGNLVTFHCLRSFTEQIVSIALEVLRRAANWGIELKSRPGQALEEPRARSLPAGECDHRKPSTARAPRGGKSAAPVLPGASVWELRCGRLGPRRRGCPGLDSWVPDGQGAGSWESACSLEDLVPEYRAQEPGFPDVEFVEIPTLDGGGW